MASKITPQDYQNTILEPKAHDLMNLVLMESCEPDDYQTILKLAVKKLRNLKGDEDIPFDQVKDAIAIIDLMGLEDEDA